MSLPLLLIRSFRSKLIQVPIYLVTSYLFLVLFCLSFFNVLTDLQDRSEYEQSESFKLLEYISTEIPEGSRLAISHGVLVPENHLYQTCHWWNNCNLESQLNEFSPDYFIFLENESYNGLTPEYYINYENYIEQNNFEHIDSFGRFTIYKNTKGANIAL